MRYFLREYEHVVHQTHFCDVCCQYIMPGEMYKGTVYASDIHGIVTFKEHVNPACDWPEDPEEDRAGLEKAIEMREAA